MILINENLYLRRFLYQDVRTKKVITGSLFFFFFFEKKISEEVLADLFISEIRYIL